MVRVCLRGGVSETEVVYSIVYVGELDRKSYYVYPSIFSGKLVHSNDREAKPLLKADSLESALKKIGEVSRNENSSAQIVGGAYNVDDFTFN